MTVPLKELERKYAASPDPWNFRASPYEQAKFRATREALSRAQYRSGLELGCGNGELARHLAPRCARYTGLDAVETALAEARRAVPGAQFERIFLPAPLPEGDHDLIVLSEVLYFLGRVGIASLARQIAGRWPEAEVICVTYLGPTGNPLGGRESLAAFKAAYPGARGFVKLRETEGYRIDRRTAELPA